MVCGEPAGRPGLEPRLLGPEPSVLPLDDLPNNRIRLLYLPASDAVRRGRGISCPAIRPAPSNDWGDLAISPTLLPCRQRFLVNY